MRDAGGRAIVITAKYEPNARRCLDHVGLVADAVFGWRYADGKADTLIDEGAAIYVGDTPNDVRAARPLAARTWWRSRPDPILPTSSTMRAPRRSSRRWRSSRGWLAEWLRR